jgi:glyoxylase-like metal-dependent hydrolase (beta-lactamase superfamily II)
VFVGDAMTTRDVLTGERGPRPAPFTLQPHEATASIARLEDVDATWVLPGHGPPWDGGIPGAIREYQQAAAGM